MAVSPMSDLIDHLGEGFLVLLLKGLQNFNQVNLQWVRDRCTWHSSAVTLANLVKCPLDLTSLCMHTTHCRCTHTCECSVRELCMCSGI